MFGPPPLGPDAPPLDRLLAFGRDRLRFAHTHHELLSAASRDPQSRYGAAGDGAAHPRPDAAGLGRHER